MNFQIKSFSELSNTELYRIMQLRSEVFVVEQNCIYLDADNLDLDGFHVFGKDEGVIHAYSRIIPASIVYDNYISIGRVVTSEKVRSQGLGRPLMQFSIEETKKLFPDIPIKISAQSYIVNFYKSLGFEMVGEEYLEDGIPHIAMIYPLK